MQIVLYQQTKTGNEAIPVTGERFVIGSDGEADWTPPDKAGIAGWHAAIHRVGGDVWLESFAESTLVNGALVPAAGALLNDQAEIRLGEHTRLIVCFEHSYANRSAASPPTASILPHSPRSSLWLVATIMLALVMLVGLGAYARQRLSYQRPDNNRLIPPGLMPTVTPSPVASPLPSPNAELAPLQVQQLYRDLDDKQRRVFIKRMAQSISRLISNSHGDYGFDDDAIARIKFHLDGYDRRKWMKGTCENPPPTDCQNPVALHNYPRCYGGKESLPSLYGRASCRAPLIIQAFKKHDVPEFVGLYVVVIETEYHNLGFPNSAGAMGMFQFMPRTAKQYGVQADDRGDALRMADASARYFKYLIADFGTGQMSVPLAIAAYNRGTGNIYSDLKKRLRSVGTERSFWDLMRNPDCLPKPFRETLDYVPKFFAAAIIGENPKSFGLDLHSLSSYKTWPESR